MQKRNCKTLWCCLAIGAAIVTTQLQGAIYYVDSQTGNDTRSGLSPKQAWASLDRVNQSDFAPGDRILLKRGTRYTGQLRPGSSGREGRPIVISSYGLGALPRIDGNGIFLDAVLSTKSRKIVRFGNNWVKLGMVIQLPFRPDRYFCLPVLWRLPAMHC